jgi:hypothetical protein
VNPNEQIVGSLPRNQVVMRQFHARQVRNERAGHHAICRRSACAPAYLPACPAHLTHPTYLT